MMHSFEGYDNFDDLKNYDNFDDDDENYDNFEDFEDFEDFDNLKNSDNLKKSDSLKNYDNNHQNPDIEYAKLLQKQFDEDTDREESDRLFAESERKKNLAIQEENDRLFAMLEQGREVHHHHHQHHHQVHNNGFLQHLGFMANVFQNGNNDGGDHLDLSEEEIIGGNQGDYSDRPMQDLADELLEREPEQIKEGPSDDDISMAFSKLAIVDNPTQLKDCSCCLLEIEPEENSEYAISVCNHSFHIECISKVFETKLECPMCNTHLG